MDSVLHFEVASTTYVIEVPTRGFRVQFSSRIMVRLQVPNTAQDALLATSECTNDVNQGNSNSPVLFDRTSPSPTATASFRGPWVRPRPGTCGPRAGLGHCSSVVRPGPALPGGTCSRTHVYYSHSLSTSVPSVGVRATRNGGEK